MTSLPYSPCRDGLPEGWVALLAHRPPERLIVFVHGFRGGAVRTWRQFGADSIDPWWQASDLLFVGYDSVRENATAVATRLRAEVPGIFPGPIDAGLKQTPRAEAEPYRELILVGHSLGGLIVRRALADAAKDWHDARQTEPDTPMPALLNASTRLFSPATAGFRSAGALGILQASPGWYGLAMLLRRSEAGWVSRTP